MISQRSQPLGYSSFNNHRTFHCGLRPAVASWRKVEPLGKLSLRIHAKAGCARAVLSWHSLEVRQSPTTKTAAGSPYGTLSCAAVTHLLALWFCEIPSKFHEIQIPRAHFWAIPFAIPFTILGGIPLPEGVSLIQLSISYQCAILSSAQEPVICLGVQRLSSFGTFPFAFSVQNRSLSTDQAALSFLPLHTISGQPCSLSLLFQSFLLDCNRVFTFIFPPVIWPALRGRDHQSGEKEEAGRLGKHQNEKRRAGSPLGVPLGPSAVLGKPFTLSFCSYL